MSDAPSLPFELVTTSSGVCSLRAQIEGETFHPGLGPIAEAETVHLRGQRIPERVAVPSDRPFVIWDVGLGAAANAMAVLGALKDMSREVLIHSFERDCRAAQFALHHSEALAYVAPYRDILEELLRSGSARCGRIKWQVHLGDFQSGATWTDAPIPDAILYDPYSPKANPGLWTLEHFRALRRHLESHPCTLSSYSRSSAVRVTLLLAGFHVAHGPASGEKDETTLAATVSGLLERPLASRWLDRVRRSTAAAPLRTGRAPGRIAEEDWNALVGHPQFCV